METERTKGKGNRAGCAGFGDVPKGFEKMAEMMSKCCGSENGSIDCSSMANKMMKAMMEMCCGPKGDKTEPDRESNCCT